MKTRAIHPDLTASLGPVGLGQWRRWGDAPVDPSWFRDGWKTEVHARLESWTISEATSLHRGDAMVTASIGVGLLAQARTRTVWCASSLLVYADRWSVQWGRYTPHRCHLSTSGGLGDGAFSDAVTSMMWRRASLKLLPRLVSQLWHDAGLWRAGTPIPRRCQAAPWPMSRESAHPSSLATEAPPAELVN